MQGNVKKSKNFERDPMRARCLVWIIAITVLLNSSVYSAENKKTKQTSPVAETPAEQTSATNLYSDHFANVYVNPLGFLIGVANIAAEFKLLDRITLGPSIGYSKYTSGTSSASVWQFGANLTFFLSEPALNSSWFFAPYVLYAAATNSGLSANGVSIGSDLGYWWFWESGLNLSFGLGLQYISVDFASLNIPALSSIFPSLKFSLGFAF